MHLQVELAVPGVGGQAGLLRRGGAGAVDRREVLRQHDAAFQLGRSRVGAAREVDGGAGGPELPPPSHGGAFDGQELAAAEHAGVVQLFRELGNLAGEAKALEGLGRSYHRKLDFVRARDSFERALALYQALSDAEAVSIVERWLDEIREAIDDYAASRGRLDRLVERGLGWLRVPDPLVVAARWRARKQERRRLEYERRYRFHR
ncbi:hypothetical protein AB0K40_09305 [Nonomuraea bangladeshensis]|uniref:Tetratricopeptide repeat protein n=1 Tax=Nonomuraea bangladeshensis TaxID=404385 RepID=A0ABV3GZH2_9ACTN